MYLLGVKSKNKYEANRKLNNQFIFARVLALFIKGKYLQIFV